MSFKDLSLIEPLQKAVALQGYTEPTPIQSKAIPELLSGKDLIGIAQTGTGKTAAFVLPILQRMSQSTHNSGGMKTLVLAPTRELAAQIGESFDNYGKFLNFKKVVIFGGVNQSPQASAIRRGVDIIIATPGRLLDLMEQRLVSLQEIEFFVLDEADRMLDMGFIHDIKRIISRLPQKRQTIFFSATMSPDVDNLASSLLRNPFRVSVTPQATTVDRIKQCLFFVDKPDKEQLLLDLLQKEHLSKVLIFTRTKHRADKIAYFLRRNGIKSDAIHGNKAQNYRTAALDDFKNGRVKVLVATDIAARGIDIDDISHVINFELPNEPESYVHRIGRTARAGAQGTAYSFCSGEERNFLRDIERLIKMPIEVMTHTYHSEESRNAVGLAAKPKPREQNRGGHRGGNHWGRGGKSGRDSRSGGTRSSGRSGGSGGQGGRGGGRHDRSNGRSSNRQRSAGRW
ncbi:MAG: DEAD/DEAH box helicase [Nanoarchaeota archaeon]